MVPRATPVVGTRRKEDICWSASGFDSNSSEATPAPGRIHAALQSTLMVISIWLDTELRYDRTVFIK